MLTVINNHSTFKGFLGGKIKTKERYLIMSSAVIKWRNRYSGEEGYVQSVSFKHKHFVNTFDIRKAHRYERKCCVSNSLNALKAMGEAEHNDFFVVNVK